MGAYAALLLIDLHFPHAGSLKAKRKDLQSVKAHLHGRYGCAVSEVDHHDLWQRATLAAALTSGSLSTLAAAADRVERYLVDRFPDGVVVERTLAAYDELGAIR